MLGTVNRILDGQNIYVEPSVEFVPLTYTPLYSYVSAVMAKIVGADFLALRLVSFLSSLGCFSVIFAFVKKETQDGAIAIISVGLFAATFKISGAWFDVGRVDSLFLFFLLWAIYCIRFHPTNKGYIAAGVLISMAFLTKQTALVAFSPILLYCLLQRNKRALFLIVTMGMVIGGSSLLFNYFTDGWYKYYVYDIVQQHRTNLFGPSFVGFWRYDLLSLLIADLMVIFFLEYQWFNSRSKDFPFYIASVVGFIGAGWISRVNPGGYLNVLMPSFALISIVMGLAIHRIFISVREMRRQQSVKTLIFVGCLIQFAILIYNPVEQIPTEEDEIAGWNLVEAIADVEGEVLVINHGYLNQMAGKKNYIMGMGIWEIMFFAPEPSRSKFYQEFAEAMETGLFDALFVNDGVTEDVYQVIITSYPNKVTIPYDDEQVFIPVTGFETRPVYILSPDN